MTCRTDVRIVPLDSGVYSIHLETPNGRVRIGHVRAEATCETWVWQHRDGERSSPVAPSLAKAVDALAHYHHRFKTRPADQPVRRFLFS
jgi:hypothetical protein